MYLCLVFLPISRSVLPDPIYKKTYPYHPFLPGWTVYIKNYNWQSRTERQEWVHSRFNTVTYADIGLSKVTHFIRASIPTQSIPPLYTDLDFLYLEFFQCLPVKYSVNTCIVHIIVSLHCHRDIKVVWNCNWLIFIRYFWGKKKI